MTARSEGQIVLMIALCLPALILALVLCVDGGNAYLGRRIIQNAADAGALAGAGVVCCNHAGDAQDVALSYARRNGADADVDVGEDSVDVLASLTRHTVFAGLWGWHDLTVSAQAAAGCGADGNVALTR